MVEDGAAGAVAEAAGATELPIKVPIIPCIFLWFS